MDWSHTYATISEQARRVSQRGFLRLAARGQVVQRTAPTLWDVDFRTAVSQAELEDRELPAAYHRLRFPRVDDEAGVDIETTRPELLAACVALVAHPDDERYRALFGTEVTTPLFGVRVPVLAHELADPEKGSGIAMICTFGDTTDIVWWRELSLPTRTIIGRDGRLLPVDWGTVGWESDDPGMAAVRLRPAGGTHGETGPVAHRRIAHRIGRADRRTEPDHPPGQVLRRGDRPLEIVSSRQWFVETLPLRDRLLARGDELRWHPAVHGPPLPGLGGGSQRRLEHQSSAVLRGALPCLVPGRRNGRGRFRRAALRRRGPAPRRSVDRCPTTGTPKPSGDSRADSSAIPT